MKKKLIFIEKTITEKYSNLNLLEKQLSTFEKRTLKHKILKQYYSYLYNKLQNKKVKLRSIRLALTPAIEFLKYCDHFEKTLPSMYILEGYLWLYPGQRATITEFINFLEKKYSYELKISQIPKSSITRPTVSHQILKGRVIKLMQHRIIIVEKKMHYFYKSILGYFHWIDIPKNVFLSRKNLHKDKNNNHYIQMCGKKFYLPYQVAILLHDLYHVQKIMKVLI